MTVAAYFKHFLNSANFLIFHFSMHNKMHDEYGPRAVLPNDVIVMCIIDKSYINLALTLDLNYYSLE